MRNILWKQSRTLQDVRVESKLEDTAPEEIQAATEEDFIHEPLELTKSVIRVLKILPGPANSIIQCRISHIALGDDTHSCLSYTWGNADHNETILINGKRFRVRQNLHDFLVQARRCRFEFALWIDAICIDQSNVEERNHQVQQMADIYGKAMHVYIWPGVLLRSQSIVLRRITAAMRFYPGLKHEYHTVLGWIALITCHWHVRAVPQLRILPYWNRVWILQEILLAKNPLLLIGNRSLDWHKFTAAICALNFPRIFSLTSPIGRLTLFSNWQHLRDLCSNLRQQPERNLPAFDDLLVLRTECSDVRDRIYGILSMISGNQQFPVDYSEGPNALLLRSCETFGGTTYEDLISLLHTLSRMLENAFRAVCTQCVPVCAQETGLEVPACPIAVEMEPEVERQVLLVACDGDKHERLALFHGCHYCKQLWDEKSRWSVDARTAEGMWLTLYTGKIK